MIKKLQRRDSEFKQNDNVVVVSIKRYLMAVSFCNYTASDRNDRNRVCKQYALSEVVLNAKYSSVGANDFPVIREEVHA